MSVAVEEEECVRVAAIAVRTWPIVAVSAYIVKNRITNVITVTRSR